MQLNDLEGKFDLVSRLLAARPTADDALSKFQQLMDKDYIEYAKVDDALHPLGLKDPVHSRPVPDIRLVEGHFLPCDLLNPVHSLSAGIIQIVKNDHLMPFV